jgi:hypothetical protein
MGLRDNLRCRRCRRRRCSQAEGASRDLLLLDIALDNYFRLCVERTDKAALAGGGPPQARQRSAGSAAAQ